MYTTTGYINPSGGSLFYIGSTTSINSKTYSQKVGFVNKYPHNIGV